MTKKKSKEAETGASDTKMYTITYFTERESSLPFQHEWISQELKRKGSFLSAFLLRHFKSLPRVNVPREKPTKK